MSATRHEASLGDFKGRRFCISRGDDGRIAENWHIEDNLTLLQQFGQIAK
jgi:hypothetical protein